MKNKRGVAVFLTAAGMCGLLSACGLESEIGNLLRSLTDSVDTFRNNDPGRVGGDDFNHQEGNGERNHDDNGMGHHDGDSRQFGTDDFGQSGTLGRTELKAFLGGVGTARAEVEYEDKLGETKFSVEVSGGQPGAVLDVAVNDVVVASLTLNQFGYGKIEYTTRPHEFNHQLLPADFPALADGDVVTVGDLSGQLNPHG